MDSPQSEPSGEGQKAEENRAQGELQRGRRHSTLIPLSTFPQLCSFPSFLKNFSSPSGFWLIINQLGFFKSCTALLLKHNHLPILFMCCVCEDRLCLCCVAQIFNLQNLRACIHHIPSAFSVCVVMANVWDGVYVCLEGVGTVWPQHCGFESGLELYPLFSFYTSFKCKLFPSK